MTTNLSLRLVRLVLVVGLLLPSPATADDPLAPRIDSLIDAKLARQPAAGLCDDAEFVRRTSLDLIGRIPSVQESREFLADTASDKRAKWIDRLLASPEFPRRMTELIHVMLMERRGEHPEWLAYLQTSFEQNKPWDQMVREMIAADPNNEQTRAAAFFVSKRLENYGQNPVDYPTLTRDVSRLMLGMDLQCAQCHDHLFVKDYKQEDFQGMYVVFLNASLRNDVKFPAVNEKLLTKKIDFQSVFGDEKKMIGPRVPGRTELTIPAFAKGEEFLEPPDPKTKKPGRLKYSPLEQLAKEITSPDNSLFSRNIANRMWFVMMGRGLVHPLDLHHSENPPSHPELLELLARELVAHQFDLKWLIRELALTKTYQRASVIPEGAKEPLPEQFAVALEKPLSSEQLFRSTLQAIALLEPTLAASSSATKPDDQESKSKPSESKFDPLKQKFFKAFANQPMEPEGDFAPSLRGALFLMNDAEFLKVLAPQPGTLVARLMALEKPEAIADELYLSVLTRQPTAAEAAEVGELLAKAGDKKESLLKHLAWALLASTEFCVNH